MADESGLFSQAMEVGRELLSPLATQREENTELTEEQGRINDQAPTLGMSWTRIQAPTLGVVRIASADEMNTAIKCLTK